MPDANQSLFPPHGGYRRLKSFQVAELCFDVTVRFCNRYISKRSRTHGQMVQAARSGVQNIAEGSQASATSKETELKLTNVTRASLEELRLDFEDFLRQRGLNQWGLEEPLRRELIAARFTSADAVAAWVRDVHGRDGPCGQSGPAFAKAMAGRQGRRPRYAEIAAKAALVLITVATSLLDRQIESLGNKFIEEGGFKERMYRLRKERRSGP